MPIQPTYPGVYIQEIPSGVRTITGVSTSITAFIGRAKRGPVNEPITINNYGDFERIFGGLSLDSTLGYAVRDFYLNGGSQAIIVRLVHEASKAIIDANGLQLEAAGEGTWGNSLRVRIDHDLPPDNRPGKDDLFNLTILDGSTGNIEVFRNVAVKTDHPRRVDIVLKNESNLVRVSGGLAEARPDAHQNPDPNNKLKLWDDNGTNTKADNGSDGTALEVGDFTGEGKEGAKQGLYALEKADLFNLLCIPPYKNDNQGIDYDPLVDRAAEYCKKRRAFFIIDPPNDWINKDKAKDGIKNIGTPTSYAAVFFPRLKQPNPLRKNAMEEFAPCGAIAGVFARTDVQRGVWKAPAGTEATLVGVPQLSVPLTDAENGELNPLGINCLRTLPAVGRVIWGARTRKGDDRLTDEWKYIPVRRLALFLEESLYRGTQWVVFEPNDEPLWAQIRLNLGAFMHTLFRQGAFQGQKPEDAYFVKCDKETTTQNDINLGIVNIVVGFAPLKPAEFVIISIQQIAGQIAV
ncbi:MULTISPECIES: phage tail sheath subtilisin-like domain-containing protein [Nostocales]|uniref:Phage tail sheath family protein n=2 Tax=Nostocales TaxID=1161 RepID=A0A0C1N7Y9_9CYAN|nr:phage tail sheath subtilisin-like domain-containing protein [Tolypothrix bouteillei]KAF3886743.1 phage tail sheath family protein [Tolypothrix bouteillei VB521301]